MRNIHYFLGIFLFFIFAASASAESHQHNFLVISDIHLDQASTHSMDINPLKASKDNDLDPATFEKLMREISKNVNNGLITKPDFVVILGDLVGHIRSSSHSVSDSESSVFSTLKKIFPVTPIFYTFGNNDSFEKNYGPFKTKDTSSPYEIANANGWKNGFLSTGAICQHKKNNFPCILNEQITQGYYSAYLFPKLRLISLNSVLFSKNRTDVSEEDAANELQWLSAQLKIAQAKKDNVLLMMHIPPGNNIYDHSPFWMPKEKTIFLNLINNYHSIIIGLLASHTHAEELKIIKNTSGKNIAGLYYTAALSTSHGNAPSIKTFSFSTCHKRWQLNNYETFNFLEDHSQLRLNKLYDYRTYYCNHCPENNLFDCLNHITADKIKKYYSAGNPNFAGTLGSPQDILLMVP